MRKHLWQKLDCSDDSFSYGMMSERETLFKVDSGAKLFKQGSHIGDFRLRQEQWHLYVEGELFMSSGPNSLFKLPEFELKSLTALINTEV